MLLPVFLCSCFSSLGFYTVSGFDHTRIYIRLSVIILTTRRQCIPIYDPLKKKKAGYGNPIHQMAKTIGRNFLRTKPFHFPKLVQTKFKTPSINSNCTSLDL
ncbi:hypothetical protein V6Z12_A05G066100 [Gossypium hirsutum]